MDDARRDRIRAHYARHWGPPTLTEPVEGSQLDHGDLSLPYLDGRELEWQCDPELHVRHLWLIPITRDERELKKREGAEALEQLFEKTRFAFADPYRSSVCASPARGRRPAQGAPRRGRRSE